MPTVIEWTLAVVSNVVHFGFIIAILYTLKRFYKHRQSQALQKRSPLLVYLMNIFFIFYLIHQITYKITYIHGEKDLNIGPLLTGEKARHPHIISLISIIFEIFSSHGMSIMWIARSWIIYFNSKYGLEVEKSKRWVQLNDNYADTLWFIKHRKDYGSNRVIYSIAIIWYLILALFQIILLFSNPGILRIYHSAGWLVELMILIIIWNKIPTFDDVFGIKKEMQWMFRVGGCILLLYIPWTIKLNIYGYDLWVFMIVEFIFGILVGIMALILNGFVFHHSNYNHLVTSMTETTRLRSTSIPIHPQSPGDRLSLREVFGNEQLLECLFQHLTAEFSPELLLALIEFKQFHDLMMNDDEFISVLQSEHNGVPENILSGISLTDALPKSKIVHENHHQDEHDRDNVKMYLKIAHDLYNKYIPTKAAFAINLSYRDKKEIDCFIQGHNDLSGANTLSQSEQIELFLLFNKASTALCILLRDGHNRCMEANKYHVTSTPASV